ncbi:NAD-dependent epimerase/dehydratase family protein [Paenibacillus sp. 19GGS1-52]|uniref:NAD-dependent epimerase/dehydratase family protein n=1 Tax=Paenibacillus sp. 19GGS1-52 TaxID=2758563 RepID=UPI001EFA753F|nr:NAD-dependent epimerase/dehydratase family protein [Paenibacillus sp. 19GGS1-52]ULO10166.1 NAD-dependent epimerase/dehydratase family protein [Paenibacillus sp. 19GGS1-52]
MKKAVVLGATGGTGTVIIAELLRRGIEAVAFGRSLHKLEGLAATLGNPVGLTLKTGDVFKENDITAASLGADVIFHSAAMPYNEMTTRLLPMGEAVMQAANNLGIKVIAVDGIYAYGKRTNEHPIDEDYPKNPHTKKGKIKLEFERMFFSSRWDRTQRMIVRLPDYYGPTANEASYLGSTLESIAAGKPALFVGNMKVAREYVYLPDAAVMIVELASRDEAYGQNWNIPGGGILSGREIVHIAQQASGKSKLVLPMGKMGLSLLGLFLPVMKEVVEMLYLTEEPLVLSGKKYERLVGPIPATSFEQGITETIQAIMSRGANA